MSDTIPKRALLVSNNFPWRSRMAPMFMESDWDFYSVTCGREATDLLSKKRFDLVIIDDSVEDLEPVEFCFAVRELRCSPPSLLVAGTHIDQFEAAWKTCGVEFAGTWEDVASHLGGVVADA